METKEKQDEQMTDSQLREKVNRLWENHFHLSQRIQKTDIHVERLLMEQGIAYDFNLEELKSIRSVIFEYRSLQNRVAVLENRKYRVGIPGILVGMLIGGFFGFIIISLITMMQGH